MMNAAAHNRHRAGRYLAQPAGYRAFIPLLSLPVLYLSHYFRRHRAAYCERLQAVRDAGDWEGWLEFFLCGVAEVSQEATQTAAAGARAISGENEVFCQSA